jgi:hypothetical protein
LRWATANTSRIAWGKGQQSGSFVPILEHRGVSYQLFAVYSYGTIEIYFQWYLNKPVFGDESKRSELLRRLNTIQGVNIPLEAMSRRPGIQLVTLVPGGSCGQFLEVFDWFASEVRQPGENKSAP